MVAADRLLAFVGVAFALIVVVGNAAGVLVQVVAVAFGIGAVFVGIALRER